MRVKICVALAVLALAGVTWAAPVGIVFILDASNSMNQVLTGTTTKFAWAKEALVRVVAELSEETPFAVVAFGHRVPKDRVAASCADLELLVPFGTHRMAERPGIQGKIARLTAMGKTPLADALRFAAGAVSTSARIVLLTDGVETCNGDPMSAARELCGAGYVLDVVGVAVTPEMGGLLAALAQACGGRFVVARDPAELPALFREIAVVTPPPPQIPECFGKYRVDPAIVALLVDHLSYAVCSDPVWDVILRFLEVNPPDRVIVGTDGDDVLFGTAGNDLILGLAGNDQIYGLAGSDLLIAGPGDDIVQGGEGDDLILGGPGADLLLAGPGDDIVYGEDGDDRIEGEAGSDRLYGGPCNDVILGGLGCNVIDGGPGKNFVYDEGSCAPCPAPIQPQACPPAPPTPPVCTAPRAVKAVDEGGSIVLRAEIHDPDGDPVTVTWSAPTGFFSDPHAVETTYYAPWVTACEGEDVVITVVAEDACGAKATDRLILRVRNVNHPPAADAGPDLVVDEGGRIQILASACDPDGDALTYLWTVSCGRGSFDNPRALQPTYIAPFTSRCEGETVELTLTVRDACGAEAKDTVRVHVRNVNRAPWADAGPDLQVPEGGQIMILGKAGDPDGEALAISWWASAGTLLGAETLCPVFVAPEVEGCEAMDVTVILHVMDPCGASAQDSLTIRVFNVNRPPTVKADP
ncbi:MAG: VWA domain-containing protein [Candidatus Acetothermia bacterium]|jgi:hypothetical protein|nr:VWA domain-containing protein [Candidatus Acetothermia bacterium]